MTFSEWAKQTPKKWLEVPSYWIVARDAWNAATEEAAQVAAGKILVYVNQEFSMGYRKACCDIAAAIRANKEAP